MNIVINKVIDKEAFNTMLVNRFVSGLDDEYFARSVHMSKPSDLEEAVDITMKHAAHQQIFKTKLQKAAKTSSENVNDVYEEEQVMLQQLRVGQDELRMEMKDFREEISSHCDDINCYTERSEAEMGADTNEPVSKQNVKMKGLK